MKTTTLFKAFAVAIFIASSTSLFAQVKVGSNPTTINANSLLEMESGNKGLLFPRVALTSTTAFAPLSAHVAGMTVYNTATAGDVVPGIYVNSGAAWTKLITPSEAGTSTGGSNGSTGVIVLEPGQTTFYYDSIPVTTPNNSRLSVLKPAEVPSFEGLIVDVVKLSNTLYSPRFRNLSGSSKTFSFTSKATVNYKTSSINTVLANNADVNADADGEVFWSTTDGETVTSDVIIGRKWYRIEWFCITPPSDPTRHYLRIAITRLT